jgi:hypothetical protein
MISNYARSRFVVLSVFALFAVAMDSLGQNSKSTAKAAGRLLTGKITSFSTGEALAGASVLAKDENKNISSDAAGYFKLKCNNETVPIRISYLGYTILDTIVLVKDDMVFDFKLKTSPGKVLEEVVITESQPIQKSAQMGLITLPIAQIQAMPKFFGEADIMKTFQTLPGVQQGSEGSAALIVRGGTPDQNLILIDGAPIYNPSHLIGIFSAINPNFIQEASIYKGAFPARFGGRLSSVIDLKTRQGDLHQYHGTLSAGLIMSQLTLEGPLWKGKTSFIVSGRRTYHDLFAAPVIRMVSSDVKKLAFYFYDLNLKIHHKFSDKSYLDLSLNRSGDQFKLRTVVKDGNNAETTSKLNSSVSWNNLVSNLKLHHAFSSRLSVEMSVLLTKYQFATTLRNEQIEKNNKQSDYRLNLQSGILDYTAKTDFSYMPGSGHALKFGASGTYHTYKPTSRFERQQADAATVTDNVVDSKILATELDAYVEDDWELTDKLKANIGLHANLFRVEGKGYLSVQPRVSLRYLLANDIAIKTSYVRMNQNIHLLSSNSLSLPTDLWIPATRGLIPEKANQYALGVARNLWDNKIEFSLEGYYKQMDHVVEYREGSSYLNAVTDGRWEDKVASGKGNSYGAELFLQRRAGKLTGWMSYTLAWSNRKFENINKGAAFPYKYDRRHTTNIVGIYKWRKNIELSGAFVFQSAAPFTVPTLAYEGSYGPGYNGNSGQDVQYYPKRNNIRIQSNHRLDLGISFVKEKNNGHIRTWNISVYNAYNRRNLFYYDIQKYTGNRVVVNGYSILPILPSVSYNLKF